MSQYTLVVTLLLALGSAQAFAQTLPTTQPNLLQIIREDVKVGHGADHTRTEAGWPAAFAKAKSPHFYLALASMTGGNEVWYVIPYESHAAMADDMKLSNDDPVLAAELARLSKADAQHLTATRTILAAARKELSRGTFPDTAKQRFYEVTIFRVRPGHEGSFAAAAKAYGSAAGRAAPETSFRVYEIIAGMPGPTYLVFSSVPAFGQFDKMWSEGEATMKGFSEEEKTAFAKFNEGLVIAVTHRFRLDPEMSYVPAAVRAQETSFWMPRKTSVKSASQP